MLIIAHPIYDTIFKRMTENNKITKFFISTFLDQKVENVKFKPQAYSETQAKTIEEKNKALEEQTKITENLKRQLNKN